MKTGTDNQELKFLLNLFVFYYRPEESEEPGHSIQSISLAPEDNKTRVSLTIGTKSAPSSPRSGGRKTFNTNYNNDTTDGKETNKKTNVPSGQGYMQKLVGSLNELDDNDDRMGMFFFSNFHFYFFTFLHVLRCYCRVIKAGNSL